MIKRPLIWVFCAYLCGLFSAWHRTPIPVLLFFAISGYLILYLLMFRIKKKPISRKDGFLWFLPLLFLFGFFCMRGRMKVPEMDREFDREAKASVSGEITMIVEKQWGKVIYIKDNTVFLNNGKPYRIEKILVNTSDSKRYLVGNYITVSGKIQKFLKPTNPGQFNEWMYYKIQNIDYKVKADQIVLTDSGYSKFHFYLELFKQKLLTVYQSILPDKEAGTLIAMLLGDNYLLEEEIKQLYQENGISHILAISGLHITMIGIAVYELLRRLRAGLLPATILSSGIIYCYGVLTNFSVSTNRAVVMFIVMLAARIIGKTYDMLSAMALSALLILLQNPLQIFHAGFLLSFGAVLGIAVLLPSLKLLFPFKSPVTDGIMVSISAQVATLPFILSFFYQLPVYSVFINLLILPCMSLLMLSSLAAGLIGIISKPLAVFIIGGADYILRIYEWFCRLGSSLPGSLYTAGKPENMRILLYVILIGIFWYRVRRYQKRRTALLLVLAVLLLIYPKQNDGLTITMLDVGQGEAIYLKAQSGTTYLIDGGSSDVSKVGANRIKPFLLSSGVDRIDYAIVTHCDTDHISGLMELLEEEKIEIENLVLPEIGMQKTEMQKIGMQKSEMQKTEMQKTEKDKSEELIEAYCSLISLAKEHKVKVKYIKSGDRLQDGKLILTCLHPPSGFQTSSANAYSTVLSLTYVDFDMLLTGDLEQDGEVLVVEQLLNTNAASGIPTDYDVLKVAHHGSKYSTGDEFLKIINPDYALISCGKNNRYGHPHEELLDRLKEVGCNIKITYESAAITIKTDGKSMILMTAGRGN